MDALDFLLKPIRYQKFLEAVDKAREWFRMKEAAEKASSSKDGSVFIKTDRELVKLDMDDILYIEGMKDYVMIHVGSQDHPLVTHLTMKATEDLLPSDSFMRVHRSYIVNLSKIDSVNVDGDICIGESIVRVSEAYSAPFNGFINKRLLAK